MSLPAVEKGPAHDGMQIGAQLRRASRFFTYDTAALVMAFAAVFITFWVSVRYFESVPHIEDEIAYVWQARVIAETGQITTPSPVCPNCFLVPFVVDYDGLRFGKYPLGWPALLAVGEKFDLRGWVNPLLAGFSVWLVYLLGRRLFNRPVGVLAQFFMIISPFFLMNSATLLSHAWSLFLTLGFILAWLDLTEDSGPAPRWMPVTTAGLCLGSLALTRPLTAVGVALPFALHAVFLLIRGDSSARWRILTVGFITVAVSALYFLWQYAVTGDALLNPYTLWWPYDKIGFGPGVGVNPLGHNPLKAWALTRFGLQIGSHDLFGWPYLSYIFLLFGLWAGRKKSATWLLISSLITLVIAYSLYWTPAWLFGPRYYYEALPAAVVLSAAGVVWLAGGLSSTRTSVTSRFRLWAVALFTGLLVAGNLLFYLPLRLGMMNGLYGVSAADLAPFRSIEASEMPPTLVIVHVDKDWIGYGRLLDLSDPLFHSRFIFMVSQGAEADQQVIEAFPDRQVWDFYPERVAPTREDDSKR